MHAARVENSPRLQRLLAILKTGGWHSTRELSRESENYSVGTSVSELRRNGYVINHRLRPEDKRIHEYRLIGHNPTMACLPAEPDSRPDFELTMPGATP